MTPDEKIDAALDSVLKASGSALKHYSTKLTLDRMRDAMRSIMVESYIAGSNNCHDAMIAELELLHKNEYICKKCGLRKNDEHPKGDF